MKDPRKASAVVCAVIVAVLLGVLFAVHLTFDPSLLPQPPRPTTAVEDALPEYVELLESLTPVAAATDDPSPAYSPEPLDAASEADMAGGTDLADAGAPAPAPAEVTTSQPSPRQRPRRENPPQTGPTQAEIEAEQARRARQGVANAFTPAQNPANTSNAGAGAGDSGNPDGVNSDVNGTGNGSVDGGWVMPRYNKLPYSNTGSVRLRARINREGSVVSVEQIGGTAPASGDPAIVAACIAEVYARRFTRTDDNAPESATAYITYRFR